MNGENEQSSLKGMFQKMIPEETAFMQGTVESVGPMKIKIVNDDKLVIGESIAIIPQHLKDYSLKVDIAALGISGATMGVHNSLKKGDVVHVLSLQKGKKYFVLGRV